MRKGSSVLGKDVLSLATGQKLHSIKDVVINEDNDDIVALVLQEGGLLSSSLVVPVDRISSFGKDAVVVADADAVGRVSDFPEIQPLIEHRGRITGRKVFTETGEDHGTIKDMYFDEESGRVLGFEVSGGIAADLTGGTSFVSVDQIVRTGPDIVYIEPEAVAAMEAQQGGIKGAISSAGEKVGEAGKSLKATAEQQQEQAVVGRRAQAEITDENGSIVVARGQRITPEHVERARASGNLPVLLQSAPAEGGSDIDGDQAKDTAQAAGDKAGSLWDSFTRKLGEMTDASGKRMDDSQTKRRLQEIEDAVGRPVTKVILDRQDNVVLNLGDIITHEAVQKAHDAGALDSLLASVYKGEVTFERDEMKAPVEGEATVEKASGDAPLVDELQQKVDTAERERDEEKQAKREQAEADRQQREEGRNARAEEREQKAQDRESAAKADEADETPPADGDTTSVTR
jgi:uncharacterized protein YrrD